MHRRRPIPRRALLLDALGTLVFLRPPAPLLMAQLRAAFGVEVSETAAGRALAAEIAFYRAHMGCARDADRLQALRLRCASVLRTALPRDDALDDRPLAEVLSVLLAALRFDAFADVSPALRRIRAARPGLSIVVVSNWDVSLAQVLETCGLAPLLDGAVCSAAVGFAKPAPEIFAHALALAGVRAADAVHVGDSVTDDVAGAVGCGIAPVLIDRGRTEPRPGAAVEGIDGVRVIASLDELDPERLWER